MVLRPLKVIIKTLRLQIKQSKFFQLIQLYFITLTVTIIYMGLCMARLIGFNAKLIIQMIIQILILIYRLLSLDWESLLKLKVVFQESFLATVHPISWTSYAILRGMNFKSWAKVPLTSQQEHKIWLNFNTSVQE